MGSSARVTHHVGERLLHDAVRGDVDGRRHVVEVGVEPEVHGQARVARLLHQPVELANARRGCAWRIAVGVGGGVAVAGVGPQHTDGDPELVERLLAEVFDRGECGRGRIGLALDHADVEAGLVQIPRGADASEAGTEDHHMHGEGEGAVGEGR